MGTQLPKELLSELRLLLFTETRMCGQHRWSSIQIGSFQKTAKEDIHSRIFPFQQGQETALVSLRSYFKSHGRCIRICGVCLRVVEMTSKFSRFKFYGEWFNDKVMNIQPSYKVFNYLMKKLVHLAFLSLLKRLNLFFFDSVDHVIMTVSSPADEGNK